MNDLAAVARAVLDNQGKTVVAKGRTLADAELQSMHWLAEGVQGSLPPR